MTTWRVNCIEPENEYEIERKMVSLNISSNLHLKGFQSSHFSGQHRKKKKKKKKKNQKKI
jgi:hypothetical protein